MTPKDLKACADCIRDTCDTVEMSGVGTVILKKLKNLRVYADELDPPGANTFGPLQWEELKKRIGWQGTEEQYTRALQTSLDILKTQYLKYKKPEIAI